MTTLSNRGSVSIGPSLLKPLFALLTAGGALGAVEATGQWPQWRGPLGTGEAPTGNPPIHWSETNNVRWKTAVPDSGTSTPIVWANHVFLLTAGPGGTNAATAPDGGEKPATPFAFRVLAYDRATGKLRWQKTACEEVPHEGHHKDHGFASASPVTDGEHVYASFGSRGLYSYDFAGNLKWTKRLGQMRTRNAFGEGSSPALHGNTLVILWDHEGEDFVAALDKRTGAELWRQKRDEPTAWTTPLIVPHEDRHEVLISGSKRIRSYDLASGAPLWECGGMTANVIPSVVAEPGVAYFMSGFRGNALLAIKLGRSGDLTDTDAIVWRHDRSTPYVPSPLLYQGGLYFFAGNNATFSRFDAGTGKSAYEAERLEGVFGMYASPVGAAGRIYAPGRDGKSVVIKAGPTLEVLATNPLNDKFDASPAVVDDQLFLRGHQHLYCIAEPPTT